MFFWLWNLFKKETEPYDVYRPKERMIYCYFNGKEEIKADPMSLYKKIMAVGPELDIDMRLAGSIHSDAPKGHEAALKKIRDVFGVKSWEEGGLMEDEVFELFEHFMNFNDRVKKKSNQSQTSLTNMEESQLSSENVQPTLNSMDSGSASTVPFTAPPESSATDSQQLQEKSLPA